MMIIFQLGFGSKVFKSDPDFQITIAITIAIKKRSGKIAIRF